MRNRTFHNAELAELVSEGVYRPGHLTRIRAALESHPTLTFVRLSSGLFPASSAGAAFAASGYSNVWIRDNDDRDAPAVPNPHVPLQWTQANLLLAFEEMRTTIAIGD